MTGHRKCGARTCTSSWLRPVEHAPAASAIRTRATSNLFGFAIGLRRAVTAWPLPLGFFRQFVPAERELRVTSPRSETPHGKARAGVLYPNGYLLLRDIYRAVFERISTGAIGATNIFPGDFHVSRPALPLLVRQLAASEGILGLVGPRSKTPHREESVGPHPPNIDLFLPDGYRAAPEWKAARVFHARNYISSPCLPRSECAFRSAIPWRFLMGTPRAHNVGRLFDKRQSLRAQDHDVRSS